MNKHTPGPWHFIDSGPEHQITQLGRFTICSDPHNLGMLRREYVVHGVKTEANARLIAAAPELLRALIGIRAFDGRYADGTKMDAEDFKFNRDAIIKAADAAIAKAEGK